MVHFVNQVCLVMELVPLCGSLFFLVFLKNACVFVRKVFGCEPQKKKFNTEVWLFGGDRDAEVDVSKLLLLRVCTSQGRSFVYTLLPNS